MQNRIYKHIFSRKDEILFKFNQNKHHITSFLFTLHAQPKISELPYRLDAKLSRH